MMKTIIASTPSQPRTPWNKGKLIGAKPPLRLKHVWAIRSTLELSGRVRDLALFNLGTDSKLRVGDLVSLRVADVAPQATLSPAPLCARKRPAGR